MAIEKNIRTINELKDLKKYQDSTNIHHPSYGTYQEPTVGTTSHRKKYPEMYGYNYTSKIDQVIYPPGTAPSEKKEKMADQWSSPSHRGPSYDHSARTLQQEEELGKKMWIEKQKAEKQKDAYDEKKYGIKQRLKNVRGPSTAELIYKNMTPYEKGIHNAEYRRKKLDNPLFNHKIESVKIPDTTSTKPEPPLKKEKDIRVVVQELADAKLKTKLKAHDNEYGRGGITEIVREKI